MARRRSSPGPARSAHATAGVQGNEIDDALVVVNCFGAGEAPQVWRREGGLRPLTPLLTRAAGADSALVKRRPDQVIVTGAALHVPSGGDGEDAWVVSMAAPRLAVRDVTRFGRAGLRSTASR